MIFFFLNISKVYLHNLGPLWDRLATESIKFGPELPAVQTGWHVRIRWFAAPDPVPVHTRTETGKIFTNTHFFKKNIEFPHTTNLLRWEATIFFLFTSNHESIKYNDNRFIQSEEKHGKICWNTLNASSVAKIMPWNVLVSQSSKVLWENVAGRIRRDSSDVSAKNNNDETFFEWIFLFSFYLHGLALVRWCRVRPSVLR